MSARLAWIFLLALVALAWGASAAVFPTLPDRVPTHWNIRGEVDGYGPRWMGTFLMPAILFGVIALFAVLPKISPRGFSIEPFDGTYRQIMVLTVALLTFLHLVILAATAGAKFELTRALMAGISGFLGLMGLFLGRVRRNFYVGIRVPWTLASDRVWDQTHQMAGKLWGVGGFVGALLSLFGWVPAAIAILVLMGIVPVIYSYRLSKQLEASGEI